MECGAFTAIAITSTPAVGTPAGFYGPGETVEFTVTFSHAVTVSGTPRLMFTASDQGTQTGSYARGSGGSVLVFDWTVPADVPGSESAIGIPTNAGAGGTLLIESGLVLSGGTIRDASARDVNIRHGRYTTDSAPDTTGPTLVVGPAGATVDGTELVLAFERADGVAEHLDEDSLPAPGNFIVTAANGARSATSVDVDGASVTLTLSSAVGHAQTVALTYLPGADPLKDLWGNAAPAIHGRSVHNDSPEPELSIGDVSVDEGAGTAIFGVELDVASGEQVTVDYATSDGTATAGADYTAATETLTFAPGQESKDIRVTLEDDALAEGAETFTVRLSNATNARIADAEATGTITDDEGTPALGISDASATEGDAVQFTVTLIPAAAGDVTVAYGTADGTATAGTDYTAPVSGTELTISAGQSSGTISIATIEDTDDEDDETFTLTLSSPSSNAALGTDQSATGTIEDDDTAPAKIASFGFTNAPSDGEYNLGDVIEVSATFDVDVEVSGMPRVEITQPIGHDHLIHAEYVASASTDRVLVFRLPVNDEIDDSSGGLRIAENSLQTPDGSRIRNTGTDVDADRSHSPVQSEGGDVRTRWITDIGVTSTPAVSQPVTGSPVYGPGETVEFTAVFSQAVTVSGAPRLKFTASDQGSQTAVYTGGSGGTELVFAWTVPADVPGVEAPMAVPGNVGSGVTLLTDRGLVLDGGSIRDASARDVNIRHGRYATNSAADTTGPALAAGPAGATVDGAELVLTFERTDGVAEHLDESSLPAASDFSVQVQSAARAVSAVALNGATATLTLSEPVRNAQAVTVAYTPGAAPLKDLWGNDAPAYSGRSVRNDSPEPALSVADVTVDEGDGTAKFTVTLDAASGATVIVEYETSNGSALAGSDYSEASDALTFQPGETSRSIDVPVTDDAIVEGPEDFALTLKNPSNATIGDGVATAYITDNEVSSLTIADARATEGEAVEFTVTLSPASVIDVRVGYATTDGTATSDSGHEDGADYTEAASGAELIIGAGQTSGTISIATGDDAVHEADETFSVTLSNPSSNAVLGTPVTATGTIGNDDAASADAALKNLVITAGGSSVALSPVFDAETLGYEGEIAVTVDSVTVTAEPNHGEATVAIEGDDDSTSPGQADLGMEFGANELTVTVTAQDGVTVQEYDVTLTRALARLEWDHSVYYVQEDSGDVEMTVNLTPAVQEQVTVDYRTADTPAARDGEDYTATSGVLTFLPGETEKTFTVTILDDTLYEPNGAGDVSVRISNVTGPAFLADTQLPYSAAVLFMAGGDNPAVPGENDVPPTASMADVEVGEDAGTVAFTLTLSHGVEASIAYRTNSSRIGGTAVVGNDYLTFLEAGAASVEIPARETSASFEVTLVDDDVDEDDETLIVEWTKLGSHTATPSVEATATIEDNDARGVTVSDTELEIDEDADETYTVVLTSEPTGNVTVTPSLETGSSSDVTVSGALTFTPSDWDTAQTVTVSAGPDTDALNDTATVKHGVSGADYGANSVTASDVSVTVEDDELPSTLSLNLDTVAGDDTVNIAEKAGGFTISGDNGAERGVSVTVEVGTATLTATSADDGGAAAWSVSVPADASYITGTGVEVTVSAAKAGFTAPPAVVRTLGVDLVAPTPPAYTAPASLKVGEAITAMNPSGGADVDAFSAAGLPPGLSIDAATGAIGGAPDSAGAAATATVTVMDSAGNTATVDIAFPAVTHPLTDNAATGTPAITGTAQVGQSLTAAKGTVADADGLTRADNGEAGYAYTYQWVRVNSDGSSNPTNIGTNSTTYTLVAADVGKKVRVEISFTDDGGNAEGPLASEAVPKAGTVVAADSAACPADADWCTEVTLSYASQVVTNTILNERWGYGTDSTPGAIDDDTLTHGGTAYTIKRLELNRLTITGSGASDLLTLDVDSGELPDGTVLALDGTEFTIDTQSDASDTGKEQWSIGSPGLPFNWGPDQKVALSLKLPAIGPATGKPAITGTPQVGETLTADTGDIRDTDGVPDTVTYQWVRVDADGSSNPTNIGSNASTYTPVAADVGKKIRVDISFTDGGGNAEGPLASDATATVTAAPSTDATLSALTLEDANGNAIALDPTFASAKKGYTASVANDVDKITIAPTTNDDGATVEYLDGGDNAVADEDTIAGGLQVSLAVGPNTIRMKVSAEDANTTETYAVTVSRAATNTAATGKPSITGTAQVGQTLTAGLGTIADADGVPDTVTYQWVRVDSDGSSNPTNIGTNSSTYTLVAADVGKKVRVEVSFTDDGDTAEGPLASDAVPKAGTVATADSPACPVDADLCTEVTLSYVSSAISDDILDERWGFGKDATPGAIDDDTFSHGGTAYTIRILELHRFNIAGSGASDLLTLIVGSGELPDGSVLTLDGTEFSIDAQSNASGTGEEQWSIGPPGLPFDWGPDQKIVLSLKLPAAGSATGKPAITGTAQVGQTLTAGFGTIADADGLPATFPDDYVFQWVRVDADGTSNPQDIGGATSDTYTLVAADEGKKVKVKVSFTDDSGTPEGPLESDATAIVAPPGGTPQAPDALAASFEEVPGEHDGSTPFELRLEFDVEVSVSYATLRDHAFEVTGGEVTGARRTRQGSNQGWWIRVEPATNEAVTITLPARACGETGAVCTADNEMLSGPVSATVAGPAALPPLTASFEDEPAEHDGSTPFKLHLSFSAPVATSYVTLRDEAVTATGGTVTGARRVDGSSALWELTVEPSGADAVTVTLSASAACGEPGAVCTSDGRALSNAPSATVQGPPGLSVADAQVAEAEGAVLAFLVTLDREASSAVTVAYATSDGTATAGADYTAVSETLTFAVGETEKTVSVAILDDSHDEGDETLTLALSNPSGAYLADGEATGTISNDDHMPQAWLARFGRTVADQVLDAVESRMTASRAAGTALTIAGQRVGGGRAGRPAEARLEALTEWVRVESEEDRSAPGSRELTGRELLTGSSFALTGGSAEGGFGAMWGRGAVTRFDGREGELALDGEVASAMVGADVTRGRSAAGLVLSHSRGEGGYSGPSGNGEVASTLTGLYPWGRYEASERLSAWGVVGLSSGTLTLTPEAQSPMETDLNLAMGAVGGRAVLVKARAEGGLELAAKSDALLVRTSSDEVREDGMSLAASEADVTRLRLGLEGSWRGLATAGDGRFEPGFELGVRHDGGDAETGFGADIGAQLAWTDPSLGVKAELAARGLLTHEADGFRERGFAGALAWDPDPSTERGPSLTLSQTLGASATGGMEALLRPQSVGVLDAAADHDNAFERRTLDATLGYGFALFDGRFTGTPSLGLALTDTHRETVLGWRLEGTRSERFEVRFEGARVDAKNGTEPPEHRVGVKLTARW